jgi:cytochrome b561
MRAGELLHMSGELSTVAPAPRQANLFSVHVGFGVATVSVQVRRQEIGFPNKTPKPLPRQETAMKTFNAQPSVAVRSAVFAVSLLATTLCLGGVALSFTWDTPEQLSVAQTTPPAYV